VAFFPVNAGSHRPQAVPSPPDFRAVQEREKFERLIRFAAIAFAERARAGRDGTGAITAVMRQVSERLGIRTQFAGSRTWRRPWWTRISTGEPLPIFGTENCGRSEPGTPGWSGKR